MLRSEVLALVLPILIGVALVALAVLVARTGWSQRHNRLFAALYFLSGVKSFADGLLATVGDQRWADVFGLDAPLFPAAATWAQVQLVAALCMSPMLVLFVANFPQPARWVARRPWTQALVFLPSAVSLWLFYSGALGAYLVDYFVALQLVVTLVTVAALVHLARLRRRAQDARERAQTTYLMAGFLPAFVVTWAITADDALGFYAGTSLTGMLGLEAWGTRFHTLLVSYISPVLELGAAVLVAYAILKYRILSIELQVKGGLKYVIMTAVVGTVLFGTVTYIESFILEGQVYTFAGDGGSAVLSGITTMLLFKPVERMSEKLTDRLFPETTDDPEAYAKQRAVEIYRAQCTYALRDASVTDRELQFLVELRAQLRLSVHEAQAIEEEVERTLGVDDARTGRAGRLQNLVVAAREAATGKREVDAASADHRPSPASSGAAPVAQESAPGPQRPRVPPPSP